MVFRTYISQGIEAMLRKWNDNVIMEKKRVLRVLQDYRSIEEGFLKSSPFLITTGIKGLSFLVNR